MIALQITATVSLGAAACYPTPQTAVDGASSRDFFASEHLEKGYTLLKIQRDHVLRRNWAIVGSCNHPEWATLALPVLDYSFIDLPSKNLTRLSTPVLVHAGGVVHLWKREALLQLEMAGISEENGSLGQTVRVRLAQTSADSSAAPEQFTGVVRGPSDVEMNP
jgi:hypothetical protein